MDFISSTKITKYQISENIIGCINIEKADGKVHLEATIYDTSKSPMEFIVVFTGFRNTFDAAPLFGEAISIFMDTERCEQILKENHKEENK